MSRIASEEPRDELTRRKLRLAVPRRRRYEEPSDLATLGPFEMMREASARAAKAR